MITDIIDRVRLLFVTEKKPFLQLKDILGFYPHDIHLYKLALVHKSVAYYEREKNKEARKASRAGKEKAGCEQPTGRKKKDKKIVNRTLVMNNERLEFLGDAMLGAIVADVLYKHYGNKQEGFLTSLRSKIVCRKSLNKLAVDLGLDKLILHTGAITTGHNSYMNGNAFEAFFGAIYLDRGYDYCYKFMVDKVFKYFIVIEKMAGTEENHKSALIEWCQRFKYAFTFTQRESRSKTERGTPVFSSEVHIEGLLCGQGEGYTKKEADQKAARNALMKVKKNKQFAESIKEAQDLRKGGAQKESELKEAAE